MKVRKTLKVTLAVLGVALLLLVVGSGLLLRALIEPDADQFGKLPDEAKRAGLTKAHFRAADEGYFTAMDKGVLAAPNAAQGWAPAIQALAKATGLSEQAVRDHAVRGQNTWIAWTGGNDRFWDHLANITAGSFDLLKVISSHPSQGYGRRNRWHYLGLINEPCFSAPTKESAAREDFGLWIDQRKEQGCPADPFADEAVYPGAKVGARGSSVKLKSGKTVKLPLGSYYGKPSGVLGLRLFPNPEFDQEAALRWDPERYYTDPDYYEDKNLVRPYRVGMSCAFCHVGPSPVNPPSDPENPQWSNVNSNPGAQYFWVDRIFFWNTRPRANLHQPAPQERNLIYQLFHTNPPGSLDTSLISTDYMNNPRTMNAVYSLGARLQPTLRWGKEQLSGGELDNRQLQDYPQTQAFAQFWNAQSGEAKVARVLKDGSDSVGILGALNRVYLNIGLFSEEWLLHFRPVIGGQKISPIRISDANRQSAYWGATQDQTADMAMFFLVTATPDRLADAPGGTAYLQPYDSPIVNRGKTVFARNCAACHSSDIPAAPAGSGIDEGICADGGNGPQYRQCWDRYWQWVQTEEFKTAMTAKVLAPGFLDGNFLSSERRVPVDLLQTNACSPLATNALAGDIWDNFSSSTYKSLPPARELTVHHPVSGGSRPLIPPGGGRGYTRPASLASLWSTAPFLQNNSVGHYDYPYTSKGYAYEDARPKTASYVETQEEPYAKKPAGKYAGKYADRTAEKSEADDAKTPADYGPAQADGQYAEGEYASRCPSSADGDPYLPCVANRMRVFDTAIREMLYPERRRKDELTTVPVPGYMYRTTALSCVRVPSGYLPEAVKPFRGLLHSAAGWAFAEDGSLVLGPLPQGFPINALLNTKLLPDNDEPDALAHYWKLAKAAPTLLRAFKELGGQCSAESLADSGAQMRAERIVQDSGLVDTLVGLSKCPDYIVNRGHLFGTELDEADKDALIEFLKHL